MSIYAKNHPGLGDLGFAINGWVSAEIAGHGNQNQPWVQNEKSVYNGIGD